MLAFNACMKEHGVDIQVVTVDEGSGAAVGGGIHVEGTGGGAASEPQAGRGVLDLDELEAADKACRDLLPSGMLGDPSATIPPEQVEAMLDFAKCMREHGIDYPDPQFGGGGMSVQIGGDGSGFDPSSEDFAAASEACAAAMPGGAPFVIGGSATEVKP